MRASYLFLIFLAYQWKMTCMAARILVLSPLGPRSHINSFMPMVETLAENGHQLTVVTSSSPKTLSPNIRKIVVDELMEFVDVTWYDFKEHNIIFNSIGLFMFFRSTMTPAYEKFMANKHIQEMKQNKNYDIVIVDAIVNEFSLPLVDHLGTPFIFFDPGPGMFWSLAAKGVSHDYASIPPLLGSYSSEMTFFERMTNFMVTEGFLVVRKFYLLAALDQLAKKDFPEARPISEIERNAELCFANIHPASSWQRSLPPTFIPVPAMHVRPTMPLPQVSLGSNSQVSSMPIHLQEIFLRVFARLPQRIIWKWEMDSLSQLPNNVKMVGWLPQQDLLGHKNTRLFIAHGGLMGIQETIYHQVPVLGLPLGRDQRTLLIKAHKEGYALKLEWEDLTEELLYESIQKILNQPSFKNNATRLSRLMHDELMPSRKIATYWVEHVLHHGGPKHLLDVWLFLFVSLAFTMFAIYKSGALILRRLTRSKVKTH